MLTRTNLSGVNQAFQAVVSDKQRGKEKNKIKNPVLVQANPWEQESCTGLQEFIAARQSPRSQQAKPNKPKPGFLSQLVGFVSNAFHPAPAVQEFELQEMREPGPIIKPLSTSIGPRARQGRVDGSTLKVRFCEEPETLKLPNGQEVQLDRKAYSDMQLAQVELNKYMKQLKAQLSKFPEGDVQDFVKEALQNHQNAQSEQETLIESVRSLLNDTGSLHQAKNPKELSDQVFRLAASLNSVNRSLKVAQEEMQYAQLPADAEVEAARACLLGYDQVLDQLLLKEPVSMNDCKGG